jgi:uncharacterized membrane protein YqgA involved in biofilm formation
MDIVNFVQALLPTIVGLEVGNRSTEQLEQILGNILELAVV